MSDKTAKAPYIVRRIVDTIVGLAVFIAVVLPSFLLPYIIYRISDSRVKNGPGFALESPVAGALQATPDLSTNANC